MLLERCDNATFAEAVITFQSPQFQPASYKSCFVLWEVPSPLISLTSGYFYNDPSVVREKFSYCLQLGQQAQKPIFWYLPWDCWWTPTRKQLLWQKHRILPKEQRNKTRLFKALMDARRFLSLDFPTNKSCGQNYLWGRRSAPDS